MMHGPDRRRKASFVVKVRVGNIDAAATIYRETHGVRDTAEIQTDRPIPVEVLEMYVRRLDEDGIASVDKVVGVESIKQFLGPSQD